MHKSERVENKLGDASSSAYAASDAFTLDAAFGSVKPTGEETREFKDIIRNAKEAKPEKTLREIGELA